MSETFFAKTGVIAELVVKPGAAHGWPDRQPDYTQFAEWFDAHLRGIKK